MDTVFVFCIPYMFILLLHWLITNMYVYFDKEIPFPEEIQIGDAGKLDLVKGKNCFYTYILFASCINSLCQVLHYENTSIQIYRKFQLQKLKIF